jgi:hypothetical protein
MRPVIDSIRRLKREERARAGERFDSPSWGEQPDGALGKLE